ncbi:MAG TPA: sugar phosphate isomerase/epimerase family protein [Candidatus Dormibacteraeota bacterium]|nr:sugar phosphate isomerase/epimerase family protein [Candidatus Dormibacteraeota bacterium]
MNKHNRRVFLQTSAAALAGSLGPRPAVLLEGATPGALAFSLNPTLASQAVDTNTGRKPLRLGLIISIGKDPDGAMAKVRDLGLPTCQVFVDDFEPEQVPRLRLALEKYGIEATSVVVGGPGKEVWDFYQGPLTIGLVPPETRAARLMHIKKASDFAKKCGIPAVQTHCGFIPENPNDQLYRETVTAIREVAAYCKRNGQNLRYETGQETPITLVRAIQDVGTDNQGINFDVANLILYGKANPVDALELLGPYVQGIHAKDGLWPTNPRDLGEEVPIGKGKVDFPRIIARLKELDYRGAVTIEREVSGPQQIADVRAAKVYLERLIG